jgi:DNA-binding NarL/FixJ family response regulator
MTVSVKPWSHRPHAERVMPHPGRDDYILVHRARGWTLEQIGEAFGISRERVHQIIRKQLRKLNREGSRYPSSVISSPSRYSHRRGPNDGRKPV